MDESSKQEKLFKESIYPVSINATKKIVNQMERCVCKIYFNGEIGTGFFTKIPYKQQNLKVLITNNHIIGKNNEIKDNVRIEISLNNNEKRKIEINNQRKRFTDEYFDVTIIEIIENIDGKYEYLELNNDIIDNMNLDQNKIIDNYRNSYTKESIYILNYLKGENIVVSYGLLNEIKSDNEILHKCYTDIGSSGSPILSLKNNKLIGIHCRNSSNFNFNRGILIIFPIIKFIQISYNNKSHNTNKNNFNNNINKNYFNSINKNIINFNNINNKKTEINQLTDMKGHTEVKKNM